MKGTLSKRHVGHRSHIHGIRYTQSKKAQAFYEREEKYLNDKYVKKVKKDA